MALDTLPVYLPVCLPFTILSTYLSSHMLVCPSHDAPFCSDPSTHPPPQACMYLTAHGFPDPSTIAAPWTHPSIGSAIEISNSLFASCFPVGGLLGRRTISHRRSASRPKPSANKKDAVQTYIFAKKRSLRTKRFHDLTRCGYGWEAKRALARHGEGASDQSKIQAKNRIAKAGQPIKKASKELARLNSLLSNLSSLCFMRASGKNHQRTICLSQMKRH